MSRQKTWQGGRARVSVLAEMALRKERVVQRLIELRERSSLTQEQAAQKVGVTHRQWQRWEAGESMPYPRNLDLIASKFGITVADFFDEDPAALESLPTSVHEQLAAVHARLDDMQARMEEMYAAIMDAVATGDQQRAKIVELGKALEGLPRPAAAATGRAPRKRNTARG